MTTLFAGKTSLTPWMEGLVADTLLDGRLDRTDSTKDTTLGRPKLVQVVRVQTYPMPTTQIVNEHKQSDETSAASSICVLHLSDGTCQMAAFVSPELAATLPLRLPQQRSREQPTPYEESALPIARGCVVRIEGWSLSLTRSLIQTMTSTSTQFDSQTSETTVATILSQIQPRGNQNDTVSLYIDGSIRSVGGLDLGIVGANRNGVLPFVQEQIRVRQALDQRRRGLTTSPLPTRNSAADVLLGLATARTSNVGNTFGATMTGTVDSTETMDENTRAMYRLAIGGYRLDGSGLPAMTQDIPAAKTVEKLKEVIGNVLAVAKSGHTKDTDTLSSKDVSEKEATGLSASAKQHRSPDGRENRDPRSRTEEPSPPKDLQSKSPEVQAPRPHGRHEKHLRPDKKSPYRALERLEQEILELNDDSDSDGGLGIHKMLIDESDEEDSSRKETQEVSHKGTRNFSPVDKADAMRRRGLDSSNRKNNTMPVVTGLSKNSESALASQPEEVTKQPMVQSKQRPKRSAMGRGAVVASKKSKTPPIDTWDQWQSLLEPRREVPAASQRTSDNELRFPGDMIRQWIPKHAVPRR